MGYGRKSMINYFSIRHFYCLPFISVVKQIQCLSTAYQMTERNESPLKYPKEFHTLVQITGMLRAVTAAFEALGFSQRRKEMRRMNNIEN